MRHTSYSTQDVVKVKYITLLNRPVNYITRNRNVHKKQNLQYGIRITQHSTLWDVKGERYKMQYVRQEPPCASGKMKPDEPHLRRFSFVKCRCGNHPSVTIHCYLSIKKLDTGSLRT